MIDFGLVALFAMAFALVGAAFHAWRGIKLEMAPLLSLKQAIESVEVALNAVLARVVKVEEHPETASRRIKTIEETIEAQDRLHIKRNAATDDKLDAMATKINSLNSKIAATIRWMKRDPEEGTDPAPEGEEDNSPSGYASPGSPPAEERRSAIPPGFGVFKRKVG